MAWVLAQAEAQAMHGAGAVLFYVFALLTGASALGVVLTRNIVRMAVYLLFTLGGVAGLYFLLAAEFLAALQLVVYAGGTLILIVFGVMLTSKSPFSRFDPKPVELAMGFFIGVAMFLALVIALMSEPFMRQPLQTEYYPVDRFGQALLGDFLIPFELASVLLLVVMIGAAYLAKGRRRRSDEASASEAMQRAREWS